MKYLKQFYLASGGKQRRVQVDQEKSKMPYLKITSWFSSEVVFNNIYGGRHILQRECTIFWP